MKVYIFLSIFSFVEGVFFHDWYRSTNSGAKRARKLINRFERLMLGVER